MSTEAAWAAGFFDGEGCFSHSYAKGRNYLRLSATIAQIDPEVLFRFKNAIGCGNVTGPYAPKTPRSRPYWQYHVSSYKGVVQIVRTIWPYLGRVKKSNLVTELIAWFRHNNARPKLKPGPKKKEKEAMPTCES